jgi:diguanylate cyclase (GGDEF)-like protein
MGLFEEMSSMPSKPGQGLVGKIWESGQPLYVDDYDSWEGRMPERNQGMIKSALGVPLKSEGKVIGVLVLAHDRESDRAFETKNLNTLNQFAALASLTIDNIRLYQSAKVAAERLLILSRATQKISASLEIDEVCEAIHHAAEQIMPCDEFVLTLYDADTHEIVPIYVTELNGQRVDLPRFNAERGLAGHIVETGKSALFNTEEEMNNSNIQWVLFGSGPNILSILAVPLKLKGEIRGMISAQSYQPYSYKKEDMELLEILAAHAATAIESAQLFSKAQHLATTDAVTRLYNRHAFFELAEREFKRAYRYMRPLSAMMMDIDYFKIINDTYGHAAGDEALHKIARNIFEELRETDILARYGGDEFVAILPETNDSQALKIAERLCEQLIHINDQTKVTLSIGISDLKPSDNRLTQILERADHALYAAKRGGRNQAQVYPGNEN